jgi:ribosomal protein L11 methyltransferase
MKALFDKSDVASTVLDYLGKTEDSVSPRDLERWIAVNSSLDQKDSRALVRTLAEKGSLEYRDKNGRTVVSLSFSQPVRLSNRVIVSPPGFRVKAGSDDVVVTLNSGTAFGRGDHPTTQLCVRALDWVLGIRSEKKKGYNKALDIGTGSGILALVAARLGVSEIRACDRDSVAAEEARDNIVENRLSDRVFVVEEFDGSDICDLVIANLRYPTLIDLYPDMEKMTEPESLLVLSGIKDGEFAIVDSVYVKREKFLKIWNESKNGWTGVVYRRI